MKPEYIKWIDSTSLSNSWENEDNAFDFIDDEFIIEQWGVVIEENKKYILLSPRIGTFTKSAVKLYGDVFKIPKNCIVKRKMLT